MTLSFPWSHASTIRRLCTSIPDRVYGETPGGAEYFQWLKNIRHTWIGHRGGPLRQCVVTVVIDESTGDFRGIGHLSQVWLDPKPRLTTPSFK